MKPPANIDEAKLRELWAAGVKLRDMAPLWGCTMATVSHRAHKLGLPSRLRGQHGLPQAAVIAAYRAGLNHNEIAAKLGASARTVGDLLRRRGIKGRQGGSSMTDEQASTCIVLWNRGMLQTQIAKRVGVKVHQVSHLIRTRTPKHPGGPRPRITIDEIVQRRHRGETFSAIAKRVGLNPRTISLRYAQWLARQQQQAAAS